MQPELVVVLVVAAALGFALTNGLLDASNTIATLVATRVAQPWQAIVLATAFGLLGPFLLGGAVAATVSGTVDLPHDKTGLAVLGAALTGAAAWNILAHHRRIPCSASHALFGGLVGATVAALGSSYVIWGGLEGLRPSGVIGAVVVLSVAPMFGAAIAWLLEAPLLAFAGRLSAPAGRRLVRGQWLTSAALSAARGSNDTMKTVGVMALALSLTASADSAEPTGPMVLLAALAMALGTVIGGWGIVHTVGRDIYPLRALDGLVSQATSAGIVISASLLGAPVSTTQIVSSSVVGVGLGRQRWHRVDWLVVRRITTAWLVTAPAAGVLAALALPLWRLAP